MAGVFTIIPKKDDYESAVLSISGQEQLCMEV